ncbi:MAG: hypothetical protein NTY19_02995 [Planctomycetota bacterium]|nr:hypothetical protein [Planctomycetota bacterium]
MAEAFRTISFPDGRKIGTLYARDANSTKWSKLCKAEGAVQLPEGKMVRLEAGDMVFGPSDAQRLLEGIDLNQLDEIQLGFPIASADMMDQALSGNQWLDCLMADAAAETKRLLNTTAKIVVETVVLDFD